MNVRRWFPLIVCVLLLGALLPRASRILAYGNIQWKNIGGGGGGTMVSAAISPADPNVVLMGGDIGGIVRSADGGQTWQLRNGWLTRSNGLSPYGIYYGFAFDDRDPNIVYHGALKSKDAGLTWQLPPQLEFVSANIATVDTTPGSTTVYAAGGAVFKSLDAFENSWVQNPNCPGNCTSCLPDATNPGACAATVIHSLVIDPSNPMHLLACAKPDSSDDPMASGVYKSDDGGISWALLPLPDPVPNQNFSNPSVRRQICNRLALHKPSRTLYLTLKTATQPSSGSGAWVNADPGEATPSWTGGVYTSRDWGVTWTSAEGTKGTNTLSNTSFETAGDGDPNHPAASWFIAPPYPEIVAAQDCLSTDPSAKVHSGNCSIKLDTTSLPQPSGGRGIISDYIPIDSTQYYLVSAWAYLVNNLNGGYTFYALVAWFDGNQAPIKYQGWDLTSAEAWNTTITFDGWRKYQRVIHPPDGAMFAKVVLLNNYVNGIAYFDDASFQVTHSLPRTSYYGTNPAFVSYSEIVADSYDPTGQTAYVGTERNTFIDLTDGDTGGVYKTTDGGATWQHVTRIHYRDNVLDGRSSAPECGNGYCEGRWENCMTCPQDCANIPGSTGCCGNNTTVTGQPRVACETSLGENSTNCEVDCPLFVDDLNRPYYEMDGTNRPVAQGFYPVFSLAIGSGAVGHNVLHFGGPESYRTIDGGLHWQEMTSSLYFPTGSGQPGTWSANGDRNDIVAYSPVSDNRNVAGQPAQRLYYGDTDNRMQVSYNNGISFNQEGWQWYGLGAVGDAATSIALDPTSPNVLYAGVNVDAGNLQGVDDPNSLCCGGVVKGTFQPGGSGQAGTWSWETVGAGPIGRGGIDLLTTSSASSQAPRDALASAGGFYFASLYTRGVYKLPTTYTSTTNWTTTCVDSSCSNWHPVPQTSTGTPIWDTYLIRQEPTSGRLYVGVGEPGANSPPDSGSVGVWSSSDNGLTWTRISLNDPTQPTLDNNMDKEPVITILPYGPNTLFAGTSFAGGRHCSSPSCPSWDGDGGLYRGQLNGGTWSWTRVLRTAKLTGVAVSPADNSLLYAFSGQFCCNGDVSYITLAGEGAGVYESADGGNSFFPLANNGLMNLTHGSLNFHSTDPNTLYAATDGDGVFQGTITCTDPVRDFECAGRINATNQGTTGTLVSGTLSDVASGSPDDTYEVLREATASGKTALTTLWTFPNALPGISYELRVEAFHGNSGNDNFNFSYAYKTSGVCTSNESWQTTNVTIPLAQTTDNDQLQKTIIGALPSGNSVFCVRVQDSAPSEKPAILDSLTVDRLFLLPSVDVAAATDVQTSPGTRTGTYQLTFNSDDSREQLKEASVRVSGHTYSQLTHIWRFDNVPAGSSHSLHIEGQISAGADDNFQFSYATAQSGPYTDIPGALLIQIGSDQTLDQAFPTNVSGTIFIRVQDTNRTNSSSQLDTVSIDQLAIKTVH